MLVGGYFSEAQDHVNETRARRRQRAPVRLEDLVLEEESGEAETVDHRRRQRRLLLAREKESGQRQ